MVRKKAAAPKQKESSTKIPHSYTYRMGNKSYKLHAATYREIKRLQRRTELCIPKLPFSKLIRELLMARAALDMKVQRLALIALQEAAELYLTQLFEDSYRCAIHAKRVTLKPIDMQLALILRGNQDPGYSSLLHQRQS